MKTQDRWQAQAAVTAGNLALLGISLQTVPQRLLTQLSKGNLILVGGEMRLMGRRVHFHTTGGSTLGTGPVRFHLDLSGTPAGQVRTAGHGWTYQDLSFWRHGVEIPVRLSKGDARSFLAAATAAQRPSLVPQRSTWR